VNESCALPEGSRVWAYCRDSGGEDQDIQSQKTAVFEYIESNGLVLDRTFVDEARPGSSLAGRDAFEQMIELSKQEPRRVDGIVLWSFSRFARNLLDAQFYKADLRRRGYQIISMTDDLPGGDLDVIVEALYDWKHEQYLKDLSRNVKRTLHDLAKDGYSVGGFPPRGYAAKKVQIGTKRNGKPRYASVWVPDPQWASAVRKAFEMRAQGASFREILDRTALYSSVNSLSDLFRNKTYLGIRKCGDIKKADAHEPLVSQELWDQVQTTLRSRPPLGGSWPQGYPHAKHITSPYLLSGMVRCASCGSAMIGSFDKLKSGTRWKFYVCGKRKREGLAGCNTGKLKADLIEGEVMRHVMDRVLTNDYVDKLLTELNQRLSKGTAALDGRIESLEGRIAATDRAIRNLLDLAEVEGSAAARDRLHERESEKTRMQTELRSLQLQRNRGRLEVSREVLNDALNTMRDDLSCGDMDGKRRVLRSFVNRIEAQKERATIWYTFPLLQPLAHLYSVPPAEFESASPP
jgi:site-specific DNA recombinase